MPTIKPRNENQYNAIRSNCDFVVLTGPGGAGKTFVETYLPAIDIVNNPRMSILFMMRNIAQFKMQGGVIDTLKACYPLSDDKVKVKGSIGKILTSDDKMGVEFNNGATFRFKHLADERESTIVDSFKGLQVIKLVFDECDKFKWHTVSYATTRMRGKGTGKRQVILSQNPERECFVRDWCGNGVNGGGWIDENGTPIPEMNGVVRFFFMDEGKLETCVWGKTKKQVYEKCRKDIDKLIKGSKINKGYEKWIKSCVFFNFVPQENVEMLTENPDYESTLAMSVGAKSMYHADWNYSKNDEEFAEANAEVSPIAIENMFKLSPNRGTKRRITIDPATTGTDNLVMKYWEGFHCMDIEVVPKCNENTLAKHINDFRLKHMLEPSQLIIDIQKEGLYLRQHFPSAYYFSGADACTARSKGVYFKHKDEAGGVAARMINSGLITYAPELRDKPYNHQKQITKEATILTQMKFESKIFAFEVMTDGKRKFMDKKVQHSVLNGLSPDLMDNVIMLCGALIYDCYRELANKKGRNESFMGGALLNLDNMDGDTNKIPTPTQDLMRNKKRTETKNIANLFNKKLGWQ